MRSERPSILWEEHSTLEIVVPRFFEFLQKSCEFALNDVRANITLNRSKFPPDYSPFPFNHVPNGVWE